MFISSKLYLLFIGTLTYINGFARTELKESSLLTFLLSRKIMCQKSKGRERILSNLLVKALAITEVVDC